MFLKMLHVCYILGMFPLRVRRKRVVISKFGLFTNACSVLILVSYVVKLSYGMAYKIQNQLAFTSIKFLIQIANSVLLLIILMRRNLNASSEAEILSKLFVSAGYCEVNVIFLIGFCSLIVESALFAYFRTTNDDFFLYDFTLVLRVAFEFQIVLILASEERLYENLNNSFRTMFLDTASVLGYRRKYENLHDLRSSTNELFSFDMLIYFSSSLLCMLLVSFEVTEFFSSDKSLSTNGIILEGLRFSRLLMCMSYLIWTWERVSKKSADTLKFNFQNELEKLPHGVTHQMMMFTDDILLRSKLFYANKYFDINMPLLYNISGTIFAYFTLIITSTISQQRVVQ